MSNTETKISTQNPKEIRIRQNVAEQWWCVVFEFTMLVLGSGVYSLISIKNMMVLIVGNVLLWMLGALIYFVQKKRNGRISVTIAEEELIFTDAGGKVTGLKKSQIRKVIVHNKTRGVTIYNNVLTFICDDCSFDFWGLSTNTRLFLDELLLCNLSVLTDDGQAYRFQPEFQKEITKEEVPHVLEEAEQFCGMLKTEYPNLDIQYRIQKIPKIQNALGYYISLRCTELQENEPILDRDIVLIGKNCLKLWVTNYKDYISIELRGKRK